MIVLTVAAALIIIAAVVLFAVSDRRQTYEMGEQIRNGQLGCLENTAETEVIGVFADESEAEKAAGLYGIELKSFEYRVAVFAVKEGTDVHKLIEDGKAKGWPELSINYSRNLY